MSFTPKIIIIFIMLAMTPLTWGNRLEYAAGFIEATWETRSSRLQCRLEQEIPAYGRAQFVRDAGLQTRLHIHADHGARSRIEAELVSEPGAWMHGAQPQRLGKVKRYIGQMAFRFNSNMSNRLIGELEQGRLPTLAYNEHSAGGKVKIKLSGINFRPALEEFRRCNAALIPIDYHRASNTTVLFKSGEMALTAAGRRQLMAVADYVQNDQSINLISIEGFSDNIGTRGENYQLSRERAEAVLEYLLRLKVPENIITFDYYGEHKPAASNRSAKGRAKNRRVLVRLYKSE
jgi:outer membrane protein OmpA-like peptidoglycan-associated protein